jgi:hypothetical protein
MKHILLFILFLMCSSLLSSCIYIDDDCHYETRCNYICDAYGYNCVADRCWEEWVCYDY